MGFRARCRFLDYLMRHFISNPVTILIEVSRVLLRVRCGDTNGCAFSVTASLFSNSSPASFHSTSWIKNTGPETSGATSTCSLDILQFFRFPLLVFIPLPLFSQLVLS